VIGEWTALPVGFVIATLATLVGIGGGILWMPYLILAAKLSPAEAVVTSLIIQVGGMGSGSLAVIKKRKVDLRVSLYLAACALPGVPVGVWLAGILPADAIVFLLGIACLAVALVFVRGSDEDSTSPVNQVPNREAAPFLWLAGLFAILTGMLSIGVGDFLVPVLRDRLHVKMESAMAVCLIVMAMNAALAATLHVAMGERFAGGLVLWAIPGVILGGQVGPRLASRFSDRTLKEIFVYGLSLAGIHMIFNMPGAH